MYYDESDETRGAFRKTTHFDVVSGDQVCSAQSLTPKKIKEGYARAQKLPVTPLGPVPDMMPKR